MNENSPYVFTTTIKILPGMNMFLKFINSAQDYNALKEGLYRLFDSNSLTRDDYILVAKVMLDKFSTFETTGDVEQYLDIATACVALNNPNPELGKAVSHFGYALTSLSIEIAKNSLRTLYEKLPDFYNFTGVEVINDGRTINLTPITDEQFSSIKKILNA